MYISVNSNVQKCVKMCKNVRNQSTLISAGSQLQWNSPIHDKETNKRKR